MNARTDLSPKLLAASGTSGSPTEPLPAFEPFSWTTPAAAEASKLNQLKDICMARDVAFGVVEIMAMLERQEIDETCADEEGSSLPKLFCNAVAGNLQRLAITSLQMLGERMDSAIDRANRSADRQADT